MPGSEPPQPQPGLAEFLNDQGVAVLPYVAALERLARGPATTQELIDASALSRRGIERLLLAAPEPESAARTAAAFRRRTGPSVSEELLAELADAQRRAPKPDRNLDHVPATAETIARRAQWLRARFRVDGARILFVGDHDLTSLAVAKLCPSAEIAVVDVDEALLAFLAPALAQTGAAFRLRQADLRRRLPGDLEGWADLFVADPPYTPDGVALFCARGAQSLRALARGRGLLAYGYGEGQPALGLAVQQAILRLDCLVEELIPDFNRYRGAQAIGSASDWHVLRFAPSAARKTERFLAKPPHALYTHGCASAESGARPHASDLRGQDPSALFRTLLWEGGDRLELVVDNNHPDLRSADLQARLAADLAGKWDVRPRKSTPDAASAVVEVSAADSASPRGLVLSRAGGKLKNVLREARLLAGSQAGEQLTKNQARASVGEALASVSCWGADLGECLVGDAPRAALRGVLRAFEEGAR